jgi:hypothetical protein
MMGVAIVASCTLSNFIFPTLQFGYHHPYLIDEASTAQRSDISFPASHS